MQSYERQPSQQSSLRINSQPAHPRGWQSSGEQLVNRIQRDSQIQMPSQRGQQVDYESNRLSRENFPRMQNREQQPYNFEQNEYYEQSRNYPFESAPYSKEPAYSRAPPLDRKSRPGLRQQARREYDDRVNFHPGPTRHQPMYNRQYETDRSFIHHSQQKVPVKPVSRFRNQRQTVHKSIQRGRPYMEDMADYRSPGYGPVQYNRDQFYRGDRPQRPMSFNFQQKLRGSRVKPSFLPSERPDFRQFRSEIPSYQLGHSPHLHYGMRRDIQIPRDLYQRREFNDFRGTVPRHQDIRISRMQFRSPHDTYNHRPVELNTTFFTGGQQRSPMGPMPGLGGGYGWGGMRPWDMRRPHDMMDMQRY